MKREIEVEELIGQEDSFLGMRGIQVDIEDTFLFCTKSA
jgi:hypothetical protein